MKKYIFLLFFVDVIGKLVHQYPILLLIIVLIFLWRPVIKLKKQLFDPIKRDNKLVYYLFEMGGVLVLIMISLVLIYSLLMKLRGFVDEELLGFLFIILLFVSYLSLSLVIFNMFFRANDFVSKINNKMLIIIVALVVMILVEAISALLFYKDGFYQYKGHYYSTKISEINQNTNEEYVETLFKELLGSDKSRELTEDSIARNFEAFKESIDKYDIKLKNKLAQEINNYHITSKVKDDEFPSLNLFVKLYKFSFYQHYILGLEDELSNYQKFIASDVFLSINQMVHILFTKLIDLIVIGRIIAILMKDNSNSVTE